MNTIERLIFDLQQVVGTRCVSNAEVNEGIEGVIKGCRGLYVMLLCCPHCGLPTNKRQIVATTEGWGSDVCDDCKQIYWFVPSQRIVFASFCTVEELQHAMQPHNPLNL